MNLRRALFPWHRRIGLAAALLLLVQALSGSLLVYRAELGRALDPAGMRRHTPSGNAPLGTILQTLETTYPAYRLQRLFYPDAPAATWMAQLVDGEGATRHVSLDPGDGAVLREGGVWRFPAEAVLQIHYRLMTGAAGQSVVALNGALLLAMISTGLVYGWPRPGQWRASLRIERGSPRFLRQLHRTTGLLGAPVLVLSAVTGFAMALELAIDAVRAPALAPQVASQPLPEIARIEQAERLARAEFPGNALRDLRLPDASTARFLLRAPERNASAVHEVRVDLGTMAISARIPAAQDRSVWSYVLPWHTGRALGTPGRVLIGVGGLAIVALAVIGPLIWWRGRTARRTRTGAESPRTRLSEG